MTTPQQQFIVSVGSPFDGMRLFGPFDSMEEALRYVEDNLDREGNGWEIVELNKKED